MQSAKAGPGRSRSTSSCARCGSPSRSRRNSEGRAEPPTDVFPRSMSAKFDRYEQSYREEVERSIAFAVVGIDVFTEAKAAALMRLVRNRLGDPAEVRALDVGCGPGETDTYLVSELAELHGVDISSG